MNNFYKNVVSPRQTMTVTQKGQSTACMLQMYITIYSMSGPLPPSMPPTPPTNIVHVCITMVIFASQVSDSLALIPHLAREDELWSE